MILVNAQLNYDVTSCLSTNDDVIQVHSNLALVLEFLNFSLKKFVKMIFFFQYAEADGLRILAFPCNQFGSQEPGTNEEIKAFAAAKGVEFGKGFDFFAKIDVNGKNAHPLWDYLKKKQGGTLTDAIKWNFSKFVIDKEGQPVARFSPMDDPIPKVEEAIKKLL